MGSVSMDDKPQDSNTQLVGKEISTTGKVGRHFQKCMLICTGILVYWS